ncbi:MAG: hypothetical protein JWM27_2114 [Gemmatimonadetes bacterium]|nr:hypothetical protein [Gemmatimonadota bacterium]
MIDPTVPTDEPLSPREAAYVADLPEKTVQQVIDRHEIEPVSGPGGGGQARGVSYADLLYLRLRGTLDPWLTGQGRRMVREELRGYGPEAGYTLSVGPLSVDVEPAVRAVDERIHQIREVKAVIVHDPEVLGGEPVVSGTRIGVYFLSELQKQGAGTDELLEDYPSLTLHTLQAALTYARLYPRRGRPRRTPFTGGTVLRRRR